MEKMAQKEKLIKFVRGFQLNLPPTPAKNSCHAAGCETSLNRMDEILGASF